jgi:hypothetical protein
VVQRYSHNATLQFALSHNALAQWKKLSLLKVIISSSFDLLSHPEVIALSKFEQISLQVTAPRNDISKTCNAVTFSSSVADLCIFFAYICVYD